MYLSDDDWWYCPGCGRGPFSQPGRCTPYDHGREEIARERAGLPPSPFSKPVWILAAITWPVPERGTQVAMANACDSPKGGRTRLRKLPKKAAGAAYRLGGRSALEAMIASIVLSGKPPGP